MKFKVDQLQDIFSSWFEEAILKKASTGQQLLLAFVWNQGKNKLFEQYKPYMEMLADKGCFDIQQTKQNALDALKRVGGKYQLPLINYIIDEDDIELFFRIAEKYSS